MATTALATTRNLPAPLLSSINLVLPDIPALLPRDIPLEQFLAGVWLELHQNPSLHECSPRSVASAMVKAATHALQPGRDCHLIPFKNQGKLEATFVPNYQGIILSLERSGKVKKAFAHAVYTADHFQVDYLEDVFSHRPCLTGNRGHRLCFYGCVILKDGTRHFEVMTLEQIEEIRKKAPRHESGPWASHYEEMGRKTALKRVAKYVRLSPQVQALLSAEEDREQHDPAPERLKELSEELYGEPRRVPNFAREAPKVASAPPPLIHQSSSLDEPDNEGAMAIIGDIEATMRALGHPQAWMHDYWLRACARAGGCVSALHIPLADLEKILVYFTEQLPEHAPAGQADAAPVSDNAEEEFPS